MQSFKFSYLFCVNPSHDAHDLKKKKIQLTAGIQRTPKLWLLAVIAYFQGSGLHVHLHQAGRVCWKAPMSFYVLLHSF